MKIALLLVLAGAFLQGQGLHLGFRGPKLGAWGHGTSTRGSVDASVLVKGQPGIATDGSENVEYDAAGHKTRRAKSTVVFRRPAYQRNLRYGAAGAPLRAAVNYVIAPVKKMYVSRGSNAEYALLSRAPYGSLRLGQAHAVQPLIGADFQPGFIGADFQPGVIGADFQPGVIGADFQPGVIGANSQPGVIGANSQPGVIGANSQPGVIGANSQPGVIGADFQPGVIGANSQPGVIGANSQPGVIGANSRPGVIGANSQPSVVGSGPNRRVIETAEVQDSDGLVDIEDFSDGLVDVEDFSDLVDDIFDVEIVGVAADGDEVADSSNTFFKRASGFPPRKRRAVYI